MADEVTTIGSEFQALPLDSLISAPLLAAIRAQAAVGTTIKSFVDSVKGQTLEFSTQTSGSAAAAERKITAPLLACVPVPYLRIDSLTTNFKFEINQVIKAADKTTGNANLSFGGAGVAALLNLSIKGSLAHESSRESTTNRSGMLEITVHASEAEMPAGLQKVLNWVTAGIQETAANP